jgi:hypothetical protein
MADVIHRTTLEYRLSVNEPDFPEPEWKWNPDMTQVAGVPPRYWKWDTPTERPVEQDAAEKAATDAAIAQAVEDGQMEPLDMKDLWQAFALTVMDELNRHAATINAILDAIDNANNLSTLKSAVAAISDEPIRTGAQLKGAVRTRYQGIP